ncbi:MAG: hypothetical protein J0L53_07165 [Spirochaetes bacterium]|nr:hypothetical protein [Spirochaetota bacterium]
MLIRYWLHLDPEKLSLEDYHRRLVDAQWMERRFEVTLANGIARALGG